MSFLVVLLVTLCAIWIAFEIWLVVRDRIQGKGKATNDRGTLYLNFISIAVGMTSAGITNGISKFFFPGGRTETVFWAGIALMLAGLALRVWSVLTLGKSFRTTVETHENQQVIRRGPYRLIRHPSYSGLLAMCLGYGVAVQNWLSLLLAVGLPLIALLYRIHIEEAALVISLGPEYRLYRGQTKKLIPWIW